MLKATALCCERNQQKLFSNLTFEIAAGTLLLISGENGVGKTTLLRIIAGLGEATAGSLWKSDMHPLYIGHKIALHPALTPIENLHEFVKTAAIPYTAADIKFALKDLGLSLLANTPCSLMSKGQQQRVALARLWLHPGKLWILDEPFTALDEKGRENLLHRFTEHVQQGGSIVVASHQRFELSGFSYVFEINLQPSPAPAGYPLPQAGEGNKKSNSTTAANFPSPACGRGWCEAPGEGEDKST